MGAHLTQRKGSFKDPRGSDQCSALASHSSPPHSSPVTISGLHVSASGPLHLLLPLPGTIFSQIPTVLSHSFSKVLFYPPPTNTPGSPSLFPHFAYLSSFYHHLILATYLPANLFVYLFPCRCYEIRDFFFKVSAQDFPGGPLFKNLPSNAWYMGSIPGWWVQFQVMELRAYVLWPVYHEIPYAKPGFHAAEYTHTCIHKYF